MSLCALIWMVFAGLWLLLEVLFFGVQRLRYHKFNRRNTNVPSIQDIEERFQHFLTLAPVLDIREFLSGWFLSIDVEHIREGNVSDFIAYAYWYDHMRSL
jgi:hypothetical protein